MAPGAGARRAAHRRHAPHDVLVVCHHHRGGIAATLARSTLAAVLALGAVGYGVAVIFLMFGAPDLAMTQFPVETLTVLIFVLVFCHFRELGELSPAAGARPRRGDRRSASAPSSRGCVLSWHDGDAAPPAAYFAARTDSWATAATSSTSSWSTSAAWTRSARSRCWPRPRSASAGCCASPAHRRPEHDRIQPVTLAHLRHGDAAPDAAAAALLGIPAATAATTSRAAGSSAAWSRPRRSCSTPSASACSGRVRRCWCEPMTLLGAGLLIALPAACPPSLRGQPFLTAAVDCRGRWSSARPPCSTSACTSS